MEYEKKRWFNPETNSYNVPTRVVLPDTHAEKHSIAHGARSNTFRRVQIMDMNKQDGVWYIQGGRMNGKTLAHAVNFGYGEVLLNRHVMKHQEEEYAAIKAEVERQKGPETVVKWCPGCNHTTRHTLDGVCVKCSKEAGK